MVACLQRAVKLRYKAEYQIGKRHYDVGRAAFRRGKVSETHIHRCIKIFLRIVFHDDRVFKTRRPAGHSHMYIAESAVRRIAVQSVRRNDYYFVL